jgi:hypothetical protein
VILAEFTASTPESSGSQMAKHEVRGIDDLLPGLQNPLWRGEDREFVEYVRKMFGVPQGFQHVTIGPRGNAGRSAVAVGHDTEGAIIFALTRDDATQTVHIRPLILGPVIENAEVVECLKQSKRKNHSPALRALMMRHLPAEVVRELLLTDVH